MGAIQGLTEFLPISSTAHLILTPWFFHWDDPTLNSKAFDIALHSGTLIALVIYFWNDLLDVVRTRDKRLVTLVFFGCLPAALAAPMDKLIQRYTMPDEFHYAPLILAAFLIVFAFLLKIADAVGRKKVPMEKMSIGDALIVGFGQFIAAAFPGASRSGTTMTFALFRGMTREAAVRFSFLISVPTIAAVILYSVARHSHEMSGAGMGPLVAGIASSAFFGYIAVAFLMEYVRRHNLDVFFWYRLAVGAVIIALFFLRG
jgi:undecaprenyl-diphosphatase